MCFLLFDATTKLLRFTPQHRSTMTRRTPAAIEEDAPQPEVAKCKKYACSLQYCLAKRNNQIEKCQSHMDAWENCAAIVRANIAAAEQEARGKDNDVKGVD
jgi:DNA-binding XRE family transcriptional regulator